MAPFLITLYYFILCRDTADKSKQPDEDTTPIADRSQTLKVIVDKMEALGQLVKADEVVRGHWSCQVSFGKYLFFL